MHVRPSKKNPDGIAIRRTHVRRIYESLGVDDLKGIFKEYLRQNIKYPTSGKLTDTRNSDDFDDLIAVWCDYFNQKFPPKLPELPLDPNVVKALIASESDFKLNPKNPLAIGIAQITKETFKVIQDANGELKDHLFKDLRQKGLKDPSIAIPVAIRWLFWKKERASAKLGRTATNEETILEYKGLLKSASEYKNNALSKYRKAYAKLKSK